MNQKNIKILLLAAVAGIWGIILYRVFSGMGNDDVREPIQKLSVRPILEDTVSSFELLANYDDPFGADGSLTKEGISTDSASVDNFSITAPTAPPPPPDLSFIKYEGMLLNAVTKKKTAILTLHGKETMLPVGKLASGIQLMEVLKDKVKIKYWGTTFWIKRS